MSRRGRADFLVPSIGQWHNPNNSKDKRDGIHPSMQANVCCIMGVVN